MISACLTFCTVCLLRLRHDFSLSDLLYCVPTQAVGEILHDIFQRFPEAETRIGEPTLRYRLYNWHNNTRTKHRLKGDSWLPAVSHVKGNSPTLPIYKPKESRLISKKGISSNENSTHLVYQTEELAYRVNQASVLARQTLSKQIDSTSMQASHLCQEEILLALQGIT